LGAVVIGTVGSDDKVPLARANGCDHVLNIRTDDWVKSVRELTAGRGVPVVYDSIGKDSFDGSLDCLETRGLMVSFGNASGPVPAFEPATLSAKGSLYLTRPTLGHYTRDAQELQDTADDLFAVMASGAVKVSVHQRYPLAEARRAHEALHSRGTTGATVLIP
jgi:NADPH2:quinone reductase